MACCCKCGKRISGQGQTGKCLSCSHKGQIPWNLGIPLTESTKKKLSKSLSVALKGNKNGKGWKPTAEQIAKRVASRDGYRHSAETRKKISISAGGDGDLSRMNNRRRRNPRYCRWHRKVLKRDKFICLICGTGSKLIVHHIYPLGKFPDKQYHVSNGITLCTDCHEQARGREEKLSKFYKKILAGKLKPRLVGRII